MSALHRPALITMYALGVAVGAPILTVLTHQIPQKLLLAHGPIYLGNGISVFAPSYAVLMGARMLTALTHGTFFGVGAVIASNLVRPDKRAGAVSIMMAGLTIANIIGVPMAPSSARRWAGALHSPQLPLWGYWH